MTNRNLKTFFLVAAASGVFLIGLVVGGLLFGLMSSPRTVIGPHFEFVSAKQQGIFIQRQDSASFSPIVGNWFVWVREQNGVVIGLVPHPGGLDSPFVAEHLRLLSNPGYFILEASNGSQRIGLTYDELQLELSTRGLRQVEFAWVSVPFQSIYEE